MAIHSDAIDTEGTESFLKTLLPPEDATEPSEEVEESTEPEEQAETEEPEANEDDTAPSSDEPEDSEEEPAPKPKKRYADDEVYVKVKVGDDELEVPVKDLKRLHGQEAALTRKSQQVAEQSKAIEWQRTQYAGKLDAMMARATEKANQYRQVNFFALAKDPNVSPEMISALQDEARRAYEEEAFLRSEVNQFVQHVQQDRQQKLVSMAQESIKTIADQNSPYHIPNFNKQLYSEMLQFAIDNGVPKEVAINTVDAPSLKLVHMAMAYAKGMKKSTTKVVNKSPKKIMKTSTVPTPKPHKQRVAESAMKKLRDSKGTTDDAAEAFMARWGTE